MKTDRLIQLCINAIATFTVVMIPFFFLPITANFYDFNKQVLLFITTSALLLVWATKIATERKFTWRSNVFDLPMIVFWIGNLASFLFVSTNRVEALMHPIGFGTVTVLTVLYFVYSNVLDARGKSLSRTALLVSGVLLAAGSGYQFLEVAKTLPLPDYLKNPAWTPTGSLLTTAAYCIIIAPIALLRLFRSFNRKNHIQTVLHGIITLIIVGGIGITSFQLATTLKPIILPFWAGWSIGAETLKQNPLVGVGVENFEMAFSQGKPLALNAGNLWNIRFGISSNMYLHIFTTLGMLGLLGFIWLYLSVIALLRSKKNSDIETIVPLLLSSTGFILLPPSFLLLFVFVLLIALTSNKEEHKELTLTKAFVFIPPILAAIMVLIGGYGVARAYAAEVAFKQSLDAVGQNNGVGAYNAQIKAIKYNPYRESYRTTYSRTNLALATSLAAKKDLTDAERSTVSQLIQQSIREAKNAVVLNRTKVTSWENLANIYREIMGIAQGADQWATESFRQAVALDPSNPNLRVSFGGVLFALKEYDEAAKQFEIAAQLKPDYANAFYNLAAAYREKGDFAKAAMAMERVVALVPPDSNDSTKAKEELDQLKAKVEQSKPATTGTPETLTAPQKPPATLNKPIVLPTPAAEPPKAQETIQQPVAQPTIPPIVPSPTPTP